LKLDNLEIRIQDYRHITGRFDKIASIEMLEAVGDKYHESFFAKCAEVLAPDGLLGVQMITVPDCRYGSLKKGVDWIQRHIFPGSGIPSVHALMNSITKKTNLALTHQEDFAQDYAETLKHWAKNLELNQNEIVNLGYPKFLYRLWNYYFSYCEGGFRERAIGVSQFVFEKPLYR
jgi:cyclopropane-fatty-acyl-phospholipid synthase